MRHGETLLAALLVFIPRDLWEGKPWNFNREITYIFAPEYVEYGHSEAAVVFAELLFNFGYLGILISLPLIGLLLKKLDTSLLLLLKKKEWDISSVYKLVIIVLISTGMLNFLWGGLSTLINRDGFRMVILIFSLMLIGSLPKKWNYQSLSQSSRFRKNNT